MSFKSIVIPFLQRMPFIRRLQEEIDLFNKNSRFPVGHFYSPIVLVDEMKAREKEIWKHENIDLVEGIDLHLNHQVALLNALSSYYNEMPFKAEKLTHLRYQFVNDLYSYTDGIVLYSMIRHLKPKRIMEIGSGFSSALMLDTNRLFFNNSIALTFIEPFPERLFSVMTEEDKLQARVIEDFVQSVPIQYFEELEEGDILFIDSTHVVKTGSDVNHILFNILPSLNKGVMIHFHDIFFPFEYPKSWVFRGYNWNESYFLRAFLMYNESFEIRLFSDYMHKHHKESFSQMPLCYENSGGNIWIEKM